MLRRCTWASLQIPTNGAAIARKSVPIPSKQMSSVTKREDDACPISVAPMMEVTTRPFRRMMRLLTKKTWLYTEMVVAGSVLHAGDELLPFDAEEHPITVQLGGSDPEALAKAAVLCEKQGYDAINLNCGCPSERVSAGCFGASLMKRPDHVAEICRQMIEAVDIPVAVKCRIGVDDVDSYEHLCEFVSTVSATGVKHFAIHARKALLNGIGTKANRSVPPLRYDVVYQLCEDFPHLKFSINGGITTLEDAQKHLNTSKLCGVMIGRAAYKDPWQFHRADELFFGDSAQEGITRRTVAEQYLAYADEEIQARIQHLGERLTLPKINSNIAELLKPLFWLYAGVAGAKRLRIKACDEHLVFRQEMKKRWPNVDLTAIRVSPLVHEALDLVDMYAARSPRGMQDTFQAEE